MCFPARMLVPRIAEYKGKGECLGRGVGDGGEKESGHQEDSVKP